MRILTSKMLTSRLWTTVGRPFMRASSSSTSPSSPAIVPALPKSQERVVVADGGRTVVCWHPEEPFPYEFTLPIPVQEVKETSVLKELKLTYKDDTPEEVRAKLSKLTSTTKHTWFPRARVKKYRWTKPDREYL